MSARPVAASARIVSAHPYAGRAIDAVRVAAPALRVLAQGLPPLPPPPAHRLLPPGIRRPLLAPLHGASATAAVAIPVQAGWNLISLPLALTSPISASTVLATLLQNTGGALAALYGLTNNQWSPSLIDQAGPAIGTDFALAFGQGYLLYSDKAGSLTLSGTPGTAPTRPPRLNWQEFTG